MVPSRSQPSWTFIISTGLVLLAACLKSGPPPKPAEQITADPLQEKLKLGLAEIWKVYLLEGEARALDLASARGLRVEGERVSVYIYTKEEPAKLYTSQLEQLGLEEFLASSLSNLIEAMIRVPQLKTIAEQDFVVYLAPSPEISLEH